jgi:hypothetical protein
MAGVGPVRLAEHDPGLRFGERVGIAVYGLAVEDDGGGCYHRREFQLKQLAPGSGQSLDNGALSEDAVTEPGDDIAAPLDDVAKQRVVRAVGDAEHGFQIGQQDQLGGAGRNGDGDCHTAGPRVRGGTTFSLS